MLKRSTAWPEPAMVSAERTSSSEVPPEPSTSQDVPVTWAQSKVALEEACRERVSKSVLRLVILVKSQVPPTWRTSVPSPPEMLPSTNAASTYTVSLPSLPMMLSAPPYPLMESSPAPPSRISMVMPPTSVSSPASP